MRIEHTRRRGLLARRASPCAEEDASYERVGLTCSQHQEKQFAFVLRFSLTRIGGQLKAG